MPTPGQSATTPEAVLSAALVSLRTISGLNEGNCYIVDEPIFPSDQAAGDVFVQLSMGGSVDTLSREGEGFSTDEIRLTIWRRLLTDQDGQDTNRITDETLGVLAFMNTVTTKLAGNFLPGALLVIPCRPLRREKGNTTGGPLGWSRIDRVLEVVYRTAFPAYTNQS